MVMRRNSLVWQYMEMVGPNDIVCLLCKNQFKYHNSTTSMLRHIQVKHMHDEAPRKNPSSTSSYSVYKQTPKMAAPTTPYISPGPGRPRKRPLDPFELKNKQAKVARFEPHVKQGLDKLVLGMFIKDLNPFSMVEDPGFLHLLKGFDPKYTVPSQKMLTDILLPAAFEECKDIVYDDLQAVSSISVSLEVWSNRKKSNFISVTGHYVTDSWEPRTVHLETLKLSESYKSNTVATEVYRVFKAWDITSKIFCVTTDSSEEMAAAVAQLNINHQTCYAQSLSMVVREALNNVHGFLFLKEKVTDVVNYFQSNPDANFTLAALQKTQRKNPIKLKLEDESRWNSIYTMFQRYIELHECVTQALQSQGRQDLTITDEDLCTMQECVNALEPFELATKDLSLSSFMSLSKVIPITRTLKKFLNNSPMTGHLIEELKNQLNQRFFNLETNMFLAASTYLDPRFREMAFDDQDTCANVQEELKGMIDVEMVQPVEDNQEDLIAKKQLAASMSLWSEFDQRVQAARSSISATTKPTSSVPDYEFSRYDGENLIPRLENPLDWWKTKGKFFPGLCKLARQFFSVPATAMSPENQFTKAGQIRLSKRQNIKDAVLNQVLFLHQNGSMTRDHPPAPAEPEPAAVTATNTFSASSTTRDVKPLKWNWI